MIARRGVGAPLVAPLLALLAGVAACGPPGVSDAPYHGGEAAAGAEAETASVPFDPTSGSPPALELVEGDTVVGRLGPGGRPFEVARRTPERIGHDRMFGRATFEISLRRTDLSHYPCTSCHLPGRPGVGPDRAEDAHQDIQPVHPAESGPLCLTCHAPEDVEQLVLASGERVELGHAYRLCAQCHFPQVEAWSAGAHGKRLDGWRGRRVVMGCADCHDPHQPALEKRIPYPGPRMPSGRGGRQ